MSAAAPWRSRIVGHGSVPPAELVPNPENWRSHPQAQRDALGGALEDVGWVTEVIVNKATGHLVDGHLRLDIALSRNEPLVPVTYVDLTDDEERLVLATLDPLAAMADAEIIPLGELLAQLDPENGALRGLLDNLAEQYGLNEPKIGLTDPDDVPELKETTIKRGDLFALGDHRLMCGDSTSNEDATRLVDGVSVGAVFTSPPYLHQRDYNGGMAADWTGLMTGVFGAMVVVPSAQVFVNLGPVHRDGRVVRYWDDWIDWMEASGWPLFGWYVWDKMNGMPGDWNGRLAPAHEFIYHFAIEHQQPRKTVRTKGTTRPSGHSQRRPDGTMKAFYSTAKIGQPTKIPDSVVRLTPQNGGVEGHVAPFPVALPSAFIETYPAQAWLDPFMGAGTTIIACEQLGRRAFGMELEPLYVAVAIKRWENFTGRSSEQIE